MKQKTSGFALIEVIVSIVILSLVLAAAVGLLYSVSVAVEKNRDRLAATYLAQECLELVRNARDTAWRNYHQWDCAWTEDSSCPEREILSQIKQAPLIVEDRKTKFSRDFTVKNKSLIASDTNRDLLTINIPTDDVKNEVEVTCTVSWGENDEISLSEILTNWRKL